MYMYVYIYIYIYILGSEDYLPGRGLLLEVVVHPGASQSPRFCEDVLVAPGHHHAFVALPHRVVEDPGGAERRTLLDVLLGVGPLPLDEFFYTHHVALRGVDLLPLVLLLAQLHDLLEPRCRPSAAELRLLFVAGEGLVLIAVGAGFVSLELYSEASPSCKTPDARLLQLGFESLAFMVITTVRLLREVVLRPLLRLLRDDRQDLVVDQLHLARIDRAHHRLRRSLHLLALHGHGRRMGGGVIKQMPQLVMIIM